MDKGEKTRQKIIQKASALFNSSGYEGAPLSRLMKATGLKKGGIYNHFKNKEEILIEAFEYSINSVNNKLIESLAGKKSAKEQLFGIINFYRDYPMNPVVKGGCPVLNSIVYSDNTRSKFQKSVRNAVDNLIKTLETIVKLGIRKGEFKKSIDPHESAVIIFSVIEGGIAISRNYEVNTYMETMMDHLQSFIDKELSV